MYNLLKILTSKIYSIVILGLYILTVFVTGFRTDLFDFACAYSFNDNKGVFLLYVFLFLKIMYYIWSMFNNNKDKGNGKYKYNYK